MKRFLFISHDAHLTGAPKLLLNLLTCLRNTGLLCNRVIIKNNQGPLISAFSKSSEVLFVNDVINTKKTGLLEVIKKPSLKIKEKANNRQIQQWINEADVIFSNTITNGDFINRFNFSKNKIIISYVHELEMATEYYTNEKTLKILLNKTNIFCVPCEAVSLFLQDKFQIPVHKIQKLNYFIPLGEVAKKAVLHSSESPFIVGMIGTLDWRKGAELLAVMVLDFFSKYPNTNLLFLWKGVNKSSVVYLRIIYELNKAGVKDKVIFEEASTEVDAFYTAIDVLLLCSKEDPYPLVVLEAASFKKPSICFDKAGGAAEFVRADAGSTVPYLNVNAVTEAIYYYYSHLNIRLVKGNVAFERYLKQHCNELLIQKQFNQLFI